MAEPTKTVVTREVNLAGSIIPFTEAISTRGEVKAPFLKLNEKAFDAPSLLKLFTAAGLQASIAIAVKAFNRVIADATADAYTEVTGPNNEKSYSFDASKAAKGIADAISGALVSGKEELENRLAEIHKQLDDVMAEVMPLLAKGQAPSPQVVMKLTNIRLEKGQIEAKLVKKARKPKVEAPAAPAPAK